MLRTTTAKILVQTSKIGKMRQGSERKHLVESQEDAPEKFLQSTIVKLIHSFVIRHANNNFVLLCYNKFSAAHIVTSRPGVAAAHSPAWPSAASSWRASCPCPRAARAPRCTAAARPGRAGPPRGCCSRRALASRSRCRPTKQIIYILLKI